MDFQLIARHLRKPEGEIGKQVGEKMNVGNESINRVTIQQLNVQPNDRILEIGMGNGFFVKDILSIHNSITYSGCDFSETMIEEAQANNRLFVENKQAQFFLTSANQLPFLDNSFSKAFTVNTLYFWEDPNNELQEIKRVLKPGGTFILGIRPKAVMLTIPVTQYGFKIYEKGEVCDLLRDNGFSINAIIDTDEAPQEFAGQLITMASQLFSCSTTPTIS